MSVADTHRAFLRAAAQLEPLIQAAIDLRGVPTNRAAAEDLADEIHPLIIGSRRDLWSAQTREVGEVAARLGYQVPVRSPRHYPPEATRRMVRMVAGLEAGKGTPVVIDLLDDASRAAATKSVMPYAAADNPAVQAEFARRLTAQAVRHARQAARDVVRDLSRAGLYDKMGRRVGRRTGWARVLTGAENCPWCVMLASRGPVYSAETATAAGQGRTRPGARRDPGAAFHANCDCQMVFVVDGESWEGEEQYKEAQHLWRTSASATDADLEAGRDTQEKRFNYYARQMLKEDPDALVPPSLRGHI